MRRLLGQTDPHAVLLVLLGGREGDVGKYGEYDYYQQLHVGEVDQRRDGRFGDIGHEARVSVPDRVVAVGEVVADDDRLVAVGHALYGAPQFGRIGCHGRGQIRHHDIEILVRDDERHGRMPHQIGEQIGVVNQLAVYVARRTQYVCPQLDAVAVGRTQLLDRLLLATAQLARNHERVEYRRCGEHEAYDYDRRAQSRREEPAREFDIS